jgi:hypothetical protein
VTTSRAANAGLESRWQCDGVVRGRGWRALLLRGRHDRLNFRAVATGHGPRTRRDVRAAKAGGGADGRSLLFQTIDARFRGVLFFGLQFRIERSMIACFETNLTFPLNKSAFLDQYRAWTIFRHLQLLQPRSVQT